MDTISQLVARADPNQGCTKATCDASKSVYGYQPNLGAHVFFLIAFVLSGAVYSWQGVKTKTWFFSIAMILGCFSELLGYVAKLILWNDPFSDLGFKMSVVLLTFAPAFYAAGIYYTLKHICLTFGASFSLIRPKYYTWIFVSCDVFSILLQAIGGALASAAEDDALLQAGDNVMITGLVTQVFTLVVFGIIASLYAFAVWRNRNNLNPATLQLRQSLRFKVFLVALTIAYFGILIRCCYRVAELSGGWGEQNHILRSQGLFLGLDSVPILIASVILNVWHPGWCFPKEQQEVMIAQEKLAYGNSSEEDQV